MGPVRCISICFIAMILTLALIFAAFLITGMAPFGASALLYRDGENQMADLFCWYKDVLEGKASIDYSFAKSLGGSNFAVFSYYLASPLSLLIVFFEKKDVATFIDVLYTVKTVLASLTAAYYFTRRFRPEGKLRCGITVLLAVTYAMCPFFIYQSSNIMWLDGALLLPLILAGVEKIVEGKKSTLLMISFAMALCFNWYTGVIDVMAAGIWLIFEIVRRSLSEDEKNNGFTAGVKTVLISFGRFILSFICSAVISAALLLPTLYMLSERTYGKADLSMLLDFGLIGKVIDVIPNYSFGLISMKGSASLFAGSLVLIGIALLFLAGTKCLKEKIVYGALLLFTVMIFYWKPLVTIFSLLREVESFWYRYAYVGILYLMIIAASFYLEGSFDRLKPWMPAAVAGAYSLLAAVITLIFPETVSARLFVSTMEELFLASFDHNAVMIVSKIVFPLLISALMFFVISHAKDKGLSKILPAGMLAVFILTEIFLGQLILAKRVCAKERASDLRDYIRYETALLEAVPDSSFNRRIQTTYHGTNSSDYLYASYNEPMAYGFNSVTSFTSDPEQGTIKFLDRAGYAAYKDTITVTSPDNIALDSLLGVKYVMFSADDGNNAGLDFIAGIDGFKNMYSNPYVMPVAFKYSGSGSYDSDETSRAEYLNDIFVHLAGEGSEVFSPVEYESETDGKSFTFKARIPEGFDPEKNIIFADFTTGTEDKAVININGKLFSDYFVFLAPQQVTVPVEDDKAEVNIVFANDDLGNNASVYASFYVLDLTKLEEVSKTARLNCVSRQVIENGYARFDISGADEGQSLFISIPYERGWTLMVNGSNTQFDLIGGTLMSVPLEEGMNVVELVYEVPLKQTALYISIGGIIMFLSILIAEELIISKKNKGE